MSNAPLESILREHRRGPASRVYPTGIDGVFVVSTYDIPNAHNRIEAAGSLPDMDKWYAMRQLAAEAVRREDGTMFDEVSTGEDLGRMMSYTEILMVIQCMIDASSGGPPVHLETS